MVVFKQTPDGDIEVENFTLSFLGGIDATIQRIANKFALWRGDWFLNVDAGVPWIQEILGEKPQEQVVFTIIRNVIVSDPEIEELLSLNINFDRTLRELQIDFRARHFNGEIIEEGITL